MLSTYPHLFIDISWVVYPDYILKDEKSTKQWVAFIEEFPDGVMIGSDQLGHWEKYPGTITKYHILLDGLRPDTAERLARGNILRMLGEAAPAKK